MPSTRSSGAPPSGTCRSASRSPGKTSATVADENGAVAIVPARGGSKRIPRKNVRPFLGVPLLVRTLRTLLGSELFDHVVVSTDDAEIAEVARAAGADVPFTRPAALSDDHTPTAPVVSHAVHELERRLGIELDLLCVVYPAAVFTTITDLRTALRALTTTGADVVFSAGTFSAPIQRAWTVEDGSASMIWPEHRLTRSQDLEPAYFDAGQFYWSRRRYWLDQADPSAIATSRATLHVMDRWRVQDIDTPEDWLHAERLFELSTGGEDV